MARTKQTARKTRENTESIANEDPTDLEIDTDGEEESETMDTTEQDRNEEACLPRTRMEEKFKEIFTLYLNSTDAKSKVQVRRDNGAEREKITTNIHKTLLLKIEMAEDLKRTYCPKLCKTH
ncbi:hypothetical protein NPIL_404161 [Nephila pilipes]|uniref:Uncharacterized protein n=1 Tax=Nephila pilipes TaxID=299642 RepID=A0A8X6Q3P5_NEPPI|nr:hypothetical protein NPIL_404161 [Nephila pilipes]